MEDNKQNVANEPVMTYGKNSYADVMLYLHNTGISREVKEKVGHRLVFEISALYLSKAFDRLDYLATLKEDWDGEGALPISRQVLDNLRRVLFISDDNDWKEWMIGPETNGTLGLQNSVSDACISIGENEYSYYAEIDGKELHGNHLAFSPSSFLETMRLIG